MSTNRWIERSQRFYGQLLRLYPRAYRERYEKEMFRVFTDDCREIYREHGKRGILSLWPRTLIDVGVTAASEHLADPQVGLGLLHVNPNAPLPWKGVLLVLIPGLVFFISQIAQLTTENDWFFLAFCRAGYYLIAPVLLAWLFTRKFPVWGLIPLGLLYRILGSYPPGYLLGQIPMFSRLREADPFDPSSPIVDQNYLVPLTICAVLLWALIWYTARNRRLPSAAWKWMAFFGVLVVGQIAVQIYRFIDWQAMDSTAVFSDKEVMFYIFQTPLWNLYRWLPFLLLVFMGTLFARHYGGLSFLLILGYLLPTIVFGRYGEWNEALPFYLVSTSLLMYRFVVALVAPVWLVRAVSTSKRQRAAAIPVAIAILTHIALNVIAFIASTRITDYQPTLLDFAMITWDQFILAAGLGLAVALYIPKQEETISPPVIAVAAE